MDVRPVEIEEIKSVLIEKVGFNQKEAEACMIWTHPQLVSPLRSGEKVLAELTPEEQAFFRCMGYAFEEKEVDPLRLIALHDTFWTIVRNLHGLPSNDDLTVKEGKYVVAT